MIGLVVGKVIWQDNQILIETASGVGYRISIGKQKLPTTETCRFFTYHHIREDTNELYGFTAIADLQLFELLLSVSGVGPKMAQAIVTSLPAESISTAITNNQPAFFRSVPGVGQKLAEKIILELKNKTSRLPSATAPHQELDQLIGALAALGYEQREIMTVINQIETTLPVDQKLKQALALLAK